MSKNALLLDFDYSTTQLKADVDILRAWLSEQHHLTSSRLKEKDAFFRNFLVGCKGSLEMSKRKLDNYYSFRNSGCAFYGKYDMTQREILESRKLLLMGRLDQASQNGKIIIFVKTLKDLTYDKFIRGFKLALMGLEICLRTEEMTTMKLSLILDYKEAKLDEFLRVNPVLLRDSFYILQRVLPFRVKDLVFVNVNSTLAAAANYLIRPFLSKKLNDRVKIFSTGWESICDEIPKNLIPSDYGGCGKSLQSQTDEFFDQLINKESWFTGDLCEKTDESKRPKQSVKYCENPYLGMNGSFKALHID